MLFLAFLNRVRPVTSGKCQSNDAIEAFSDELEQELQRLHQVDAADHQSVVTTAVPSLRWMPRSWLSLNHGGARKTWRVRRESDVSEVR